MICKMLAHIKGHGWGSVLEQVLLVFIGHLKTFFDLGIHDPYLYLSLYVAVFLCACPSTSLLLQGHV